MFTVYVKSMSEDTVDGIRCATLYSRLKYYHNANFRVLSLEDPKVLAEFEVRFPRWVELPQVFWCDSLIGNTFATYEFLKKNSDRHLNFIPPELEKPHRYSWRVPQKSDLADTFAANVVQI
jgi:hypothetical protein